MRAAVVRVRNHTQPPTCKVDRRGHGRSGRNHLPSRGGVRHPRIPPRLRRGLRRQRREGRQKPNCRALHRAAVDENGVPNLLGTFKVGTDPGLIPMAQSQSRRQLVPSSPNPPQTGPYPNLRRGRAGSSSDVQHAGARQCRASRPLCSVQFLVAPRARGAPRPANAGLKQEVANRQCRPCIIITRTSRQI